MNQLALQFDVPRQISEAANDLNFKPARAFQSPRSTLELAEEIQELNRQRQLEPTSLPKVLRGRAPYRRPQTAIISRAAQAAYERRINADSADINRALTYIERRGEKRIKRLAETLTT